MKIKFWLKAIRAYSLPASIAPVLMGAAYSFWQSGLLNFWHFLAALLGGVSYHISVNLLNDVYDYQKGVDTEGSLGGSGVLVAKEADSGTFLYAAYVTCLLGSLIGLYFVFRFGVPVIALGLLGLAGVFGYTRSGLSAKYTALGLPLVAATMGVGMVLGGYLTQSGVVNIEAALVSLPVAFLVTAILQANDLRDITFDRQANIKTVSTIVGPKHARLLLDALLFSTFASVPALVSWQLLPVTSLAVLLALPGAIKIHRLAWKYPEEFSPLLSPIVEKTAKLHMAVGLILSLSLVLDRVYVSL